MKLWLPEHRCIHARGSHECFISLDYTADTQTRKLTCTDHEKITFKDSGTVLRHCIDQTFMPCFGPIRTFFRHTITWTLVKNARYKMTQFFKNSRCDLCLTCFSFNVHCSFQVVECNSVLRWAGNWLCIRQQLMTTFFWLHKSLWVRCMYITKFILTIIILPDKCQRVAYVWVFVSVCIYHLQDVLWVDQSTVSCYTAILNPRPTSAAHCAWDNVPLMFSAVQMQYLWYHVQTALHSFTCISPTNKKLTT